MNYSCPHNHSTADSGFTVIEVIIAIALLAVVVSSGALAVVSSDRARQTSDLISRADAIAAKALDRAQTDKANYSTCASTLVTWTSIPATSSIPTCTFSYSGMRDEDGRQYIVSVRVQPVDDAEDGTRTDDTDRSLDRYDATVTAQLDASKGMTTGLSASQLVPAVLEGTLDWSGQKGETLGTVRVHVCKVPRAERGQDTRECTTDGTANRGPVSTLVSLAQQDTTTPVTLSQTSDATSGIALFGGTVSPGRYTVSVTVPTGLSQLATTTRSLVITDGSTRDVYVSLAPVPTTTLICATRTTADGGSGYEENRTNITMRRQGNAARYSMPIWIGAQNAWSCAQTSTGTPATYFQDVLNTSGPTSIAPGEYDIEVSQDAKVGPPLVLGMYVAGYYVRNGTTSAACTSGTIPTGTSIATRSQSPLDRPQAATEDPSWYGTYTLADTSAKVICLQFYTRPIQRAVCTTPTQFADCTAAGTVCVPKVIAYGTYVFGTATCPGPTSICVSACGTTTPPGTLSGTKFTAPNGWVTGGPNESVISCKNHLYSGVFPAYSKAANVLVGYALSTHVAQGTWIQYPFLGTYVSTYGPTGPHNADGGQYWCNRIGFAFDAGKVGAGKPWHLGDCIRAWYTPPWTYTQRWVQGKIIDVANFGTHPSDIMPTIATWRELLNDVPAVYNDYFAGFIGGSAATVNGIGAQPGLGTPTLTYQKVINDPTCSTGTLSTTPVYQDFMPDYVTAYTHPVNDPALAEPVLISPPSNVGTYTSSL